MILNEWSAAYKNKKKQSHSDRVPLEISDLLKKISMSLKNIHFLAVSVGPGRFTGVRTAVNVIKSLSFSLNIPCYPLDTLRVTAEPFLDKNPVVAFNAFKESVYCSFFSEKGKNQKGPCVLSFSRYLEMIKDETLCIGDVPFFYSIPFQLKERCSFQQAYPQAHHLASVVCSEFDSRNLIPWSQLKPLYLRSQI